MTHEHIPRREHPGPWPGIRTFKRTDKVLAIEAEFNGEAIEKIIWDMAADDYPKIIVSGALGYARAEFYCRLKSSKDRGLEFPWASIFEQRREPVHYEHTPARMAAARANAEKARAARGAARITPAMAQEAERIRALTKGTWDSVAKQLGVSTGALRKARADLGTTDPKKVAKSRGAAWRADNDAHYQKTMERKSVHA